MNAAGAGSGSLMADNRLALAWFALALGALGISALFAVLLIVARIPFMGLGSNAFQTALVQHVTLSGSVWVMAVAAGWWSVGRRDNAWLRWSGFGMALVGTLAMTVTPLIGNGRPVLRTYIALLDHPIFLAGFMLLGAGLCLAAGCALFARLTNDHGAWLSPVKLSALAFLIAMAAFLVDLFLPIQSGPGTFRLERGFWGLGHNMQHVQLMLLMAAWLGLGDRALVRVAQIRSWLPWLFVAVVVPVAVGPVLNWAAYASGLGSLDGYTTLLRWAAWLPALLLAVALSLGLLRARRERRWDEDERALALSITLFVAGCLLGASVQVEALTIPAHDHAIVGSVTLAFLMWIRRMAGEMGMLTPDLTPTRGLPGAYGLGMLLMVLGHFGAGLLEIVSKTPHVGGNLDISGRWVAVGAVGLGGVLALSAVAIMVFMALRLAYGASRGSRLPRRDTRLILIGVAALAVLLGGWLVKLVPGSYQGGTSYFLDPVSEKTRLETDQRFTQGIIMLHAKQYEHALTAFFRVMEIAPGMPEAYVNAGFSLLGLQRFQEAHDVFDYATQLRRDQTNAYYGLALALEGIGDLPGALGAMQTYAHLAGKDDPHRAKAEADLVKWRKSLRAQKR